MVPPVKNCERCNKLCDAATSSANTEYCNDCRRNPLVECVYCLLPFNLKKENSDPACRFCIRDMVNFGPPRACICCKMNAAFNGNMCNRCTKSAGMHGSPVPCEQCGETRAFNSAKKADDRTLCWACTKSCPRQSFQKRKKNLADCQPEPPPKSARFNNRPGILGEPSIDKLVAEKVESEGKLIVARNQLIIMEKQLIEQQKEITGLKAALADQARASKNTLEQWKTWHKQEINNLHRVYNEKINELKKGK